MTPGTEMNMNPTMLNNQTQNNGRRGNYRCGNESSAVRTEMKNFIGEMPDLEAILTALSLNGERRLFTF